MAVMLPYSTENFKKYPEVNVPKPEVITSPTYF